jgi:hypothetical protein
MKSYLSFALLLAATPAVADVVLLRNGGRLEGSASEEGDRIVLRLESGVVRIPKAEVLQVQKTPAPLDEYQSRAAALGNDATAHWELALWCETAGLSRSARIEWEAVIRIDPEHAAAREKLGYEKVEGRWLRGTELLVAQGMVKVDGAWVTREEADAIAAAKKKREEDRIAAAERARVARLEREAALAREAAAADAAFQTFWSDSCARQRSHGYGYAYGGYGYYGYPYGYFYDQVPSRSPRPNRGAGNPYVRKGSHFAGPYLPSRH